MKQNMTVRNMAMRCGVKHWRIAAELGVSEQTLVRWLRFPLSEDKEKEIIEVIERLAKGDC